MANYASGNVGPHALLEMDETASDLTKGVIALTDVAAEAGVNKFTGQESFFERSEVSDVWRCADSAGAFTVCLVCRRARRGGWADPEPVEVGCVL